MIYRTIQNKLANSSLLRYLFIGGISYAIELIFIFIISIATKNELLGVGVGFWIGLGVSFLLQKIFAFKNTDKGVKRLTIQTIAYLLLVAINYSFTLWFVWQLSALLGLFLSRTVALLITTAWNYLVYKHIIFKQ